MKLKKQLSLLLASLIFILSCPITTFAESSEDFSYVQLFKKNDVSYIEITSYNGRSNSVVIPSEIDGRIVLGTGYNTFVSNNFHPKKVVVSEGIEYIGGFRGFKELSVTLPSTLKSINNNAFACSNISSINFPDGLEGIDFEAFNCTNFASDDIILPNSLLYLSELAFDGSNVKNIHFGSKAQIATYDYNGGVGFNNIYTNIGSDFRNPFAECRSLLSIKVDKSNPYLTSADGVLYSKDMSTIISYARNGHIKNNKYEMPNTVTSVFWYAFSASTGIPEVVINDKIDEIPDDSFSKAKIEKLSYSSNCKIEKIGKYAFRLADINDITIPKSVKVIDDYAFDQSTITSLSFESNSSCQAINQYAFCDCNNLKSVYIPKCVSKIGNYAFNSCDELSSFVFENNSHLKELNPIFENNSKLTNIDLSECKNLSKISSNTFAGNNTIEKIDLSNTQINIIDKNTFKNCTNLKTVILPDCTYSIGDNGFYNCNSLQNINTNYIFKIGTNAFYNCRLLKDIPTVSEEKTYNNFKYFESNNAVAISGYIGADKDLVIPDYINSKPVTAILNNAFLGAKKTNNLTLPNTLTYIGSYAFSQNSNLSGTLEIPSNVETISESAFSHCAIDEIILNDGIKTISNNAFYANKFKDVIIPNTVSSIGSKAFFNESVKNVIFGTGIEDIEEVVKNNFVTLNYKPSEATDRYEDFVFVENFFIPDECQNYSTKNGIIYNKNKSVLLFYPQGKTNKEISIIKSVNKIEDYAFRYSENLEKVTIGSNVESIGKNAFDSSKSLNTVIFKSGFSTKKLEETFYKCTALKNIIFENNVNIPYLFSTFAGTGLEKLDLNCNPQYIFEICYECNNLKEVFFYDGLKTIDNYSFADTALRKVIIPNTVLELDDYAFSNCKDLAYINLSNVKSLGRRTFQNCISLTSIDLTGVLYKFNSKDYGTFKGCDNLTKFYFTAEEKRAYIAENEFQGNETLKTVVIGGSIEQLMGESFADCPNLETAYISSGVKEIDDTAFNNCDKLTIVCMEYSAAMYYAEKNEIPYETFVIAPINDQRYTGQEIKPELDVSQGNSPLTLNAEYSAIYSNNINIGTAKVTVTGLGDYSIFGTTTKFNIIENPLIESPILNSNNNKETSFTDDLSQDDFDTNSPAVSKNKSSISKSKNDTKTQNSDTEKTFSADKESETNSKDVNESKLIGNAEEKADSNSESEKKENSVVKFFSKIIKAISSFISRFISFIKSLFAKI